MAFVRTACRPARIPVFADEEMGPDWVAKLGSWHPAVIYSFNYRRLLPRRILECARIGAFNVHPSKLPAYRGRAPINWVLVNGERETGVTLHHMVARADAGDIVGQETVAIEDHDTALSLSRKITPLAASLIARFHPLIVCGRARASAGSGAPAATLAGARPPTGGSTGIGRRGESSIWCAP